jgi:hypothetical protein
MPMNAPSRSSPILGLVRTLLLTGCNGGKGPQEPATSAAPRESRVYNRAVYISAPKITDDLASGEIGLAKGGSGM